MRKFNRSKFGFALAEMVLVIAIIVILAAVMIINVRTYLSAAQSRSNRAESVRASTITNIGQCESRMTTLGFGATSGGVNVVTPSPTGSPVSST